MSLAERLRMVQASGGPPGPTSPNAPGLVILYTMDDIAGAALGDESANNLDGTIIGATTVAGASGNALQFDGVNDSVSVPTFTRTDEGAISLWARQDNSAAYSIFMSVTNPASSAAGMILRFVGGTSQVQCVTPGRTVTTVAGFTDTNRFYHIVITSDGANVQIYVDGVIQATTSSPSNTGAWVDDLPVDMTTVNIGLYALSTGNFYHKGTFDYWRLYNVNLIQADVNALYNGGVAV